MAVEILWDNRKHIAAMYCTTSDTAFGPIFDEAQSAEDFLAWLRENADSIPWAVASPSRGGDGTDPRHYTAYELERVVNHWREVTEDARRA